MNIIFRPLLKSDFSLLLSWLQASQVRQWWDSEIVWTPDFIKEKYSSYVAGYKYENGVAKQIDAYIIELDGRSVGYVQIYNAYDFARSTPLVGLPDFLAAIDFFIGDKDYIGKGLGTYILSTFLKDFCRKNYAYTHIFVDPDSENRAAIRMYEKVRFKKVMSPCKKTQEIWMLYINT